MNPEFGFIYKSLNTIKPYLTTIIDFKSTSGNKPAVEDRKHNRVSNRKILSIKWEVQKHITCIRT